MTEFKIFSSYFVSSVGFDRNGKKTVIRNRVSKRVRDVLVDLSAAYDEHVAQNEDKFIISARTGHLDMFGRVICLLKEKIDITIESQIVELQGREQDYQAVELRAILDGGLKLPPLEELLARV